MKRVLHVVGGMNQGGTENFLMNLYRKIDRSKVQFDFLVNRPGFFDEEIIKMGGRIYTIPALQKVGYFKYTNNLDNFFKDYKGEYRIIHSHINKVSGLILKYAKKNDIPVRIAHSHGSQYHCNYFARIYKELLGTLILKNATNYFACSLIASKFLFGKSYKDAIFIKNGVETSKFIYSDISRKRIRQKYSIDDNTFVIGNIGRFAEQKNQLFLLDIFSEFHKINNNSCLMLIGEGALKDKLEKKVKKLNLDNYVIFVGTTDDTPSYYSAFDCFVLPSKSEGLGIVLIEAQISGLICLTSKDCVPNEAKITDLLQFISLKKSAFDWASQIKKNINRTDVKITNSYDMQAQANDLLQFYLSEDDSNLKRVDSNDGKN